MTTTPTVWRAEFTANAGSTTGAQFNPYTIGLTDDRFLTVWSDDTGGSEAGYDILGQMFDANGVPTGAVFQLNSAFFVDGEFLGSIAAAPDGGFIIAYVDDNGSSADDIHIERYNAAGSRTSFATISGGSNPIADPEITVSANGSYMVTFDRTTGSDVNIRAVIYDSSNTASAEFNAAQNSADRDANPDVAALSNGNFVTVYEETDGTTIGTEFLIVDATGAYVANQNISATAGFDPSVSALTGGGFVVAWNDDANNGDIRFSIFGNTGGAAIADQIVVAGGANSQNEPKVIGLNDGGFFVVWDDDTTDHLIGQRYNATGTAIGSNVDIATSITDPELGLTDDGRILVTFLGSTGEISQVILDPRDNAIVGSGVNDVITSRIEGASVDGSYGSDTLLGQGGNDTLYGGFSTDSVYGGAGNDLIVVRDGEFGDNTDGGADIDTLDFSNLTNYSVILSMEAGNYTERDVNNTQFGDVNTLTGIENVNGSQRGDFISGGTTFVDNVFNGLGGNDTIEGGYNGDTLNGGAGNDVIYAMTQSAPEGSGVGDKIDGGDGNDFIVGSGGTDAIIGGIGNDTLNGGTYNDTMTGGAGNDIYYVDDAGDKVVEVANGGADIVHTTLATYTLGANLEWLYMDGTGANIARGNDLANRVYGNSGDDRFVVDSGGADTFYGGNGIDSFDARSSTTGIILHLENQANNAGAIAGDTFGSVERFSGSNTAADSMTANAGRAYFVGGGGNDTLIGGVNNDNLIGGDGNDSLVGGGARDVLWGGTGDDRMSGGTSADRDYFQFGEANFGRDLITDFQDGVDVLKFLSSVANDVSDFTIAGNGTNHVVLTLSAGNTITLNGSAAITITNHDFMFY